MIANEHFELDAEDAESFDGGYHKVAKAQHKERVAQNPDRVEYAKKLLTENDIEFYVKNEATGHIHAYRKSDGKLFQFWAGTGKIMGYNNKRGIHCFINILNGKEN